MMFLGKIFCVFCIVAVLAATFPKLLGTVLGIAFLWYTFKLIRMFWRFIKNGDDSVWRCFGL
jgi:hypothetical protein